MYSKCIIAHYSLRMPGRGFKNTSFVLWLQRPAKWCAHLSNQAHCQPCISPLQVSKSNENPNRHLLERAFSISKGHNSTWVFPLPLQECSETLHTGNIHSHLHRFLVKQRLQKVVSSSIPSLTFCFSPPRPLQEEVQPPRSFYPMNLLFSLWTTSFVLHTNSDSKEYYASHLVKFPSCHY